MSRTYLRDTSDRTPEVSSQPRISHRSGSLVRKSNQPAAVTCSSVATGAVRPHRSEGSTIRALMDLALAKFAESGDRPVRPHRPWVVMTDSPASPAPVRSTGLLGSPSTCLNLDALSSGEDDESAEPGDISAAPICVSDDCLTPVNTNQVLSDEDLPAAAGAEDRRQVIRIRDVSPDVPIVDLSQVGQDWDIRRTVWGARHPKDIPGGRLQQSAFVGALSPEVRASDIPPGAGAADLTPVVRPDDVPQVGRMETVQPSTPLDSGGCPLIHLRRSLLMIWRTHQYRCPPIVCKLGSLRMFRMREVCLTCRQFRQVFFNVTVGCRCAAARSRCAIPSGLGYF